MKTIRRSSSGIGFRRFRHFAGGIAFCWLATTIQAATVAVGTLSYDTFIPAGNGSPGVDAFDLSNLTGAFSLPTDFPVIEALTFGSATLTLTLNDLSQTVFTLGDIGPGFLLDQNGNPIVQVSGGQAFHLAEFSATLSPLTFTLSDGTSFTAGSSSIDVLLSPSSGQTLVVDVDQTIIGVSRAAQPITPEPASLSLVLPVLLALAWGIQRRRGLWARIRERI
jgi:hypothetical protein